MENGNWLNLPSDETFPLYFKPDDVAFDLNGVESFDVELNDGSMIKMLEEQSEDAQVYRIGILETKKDPNQTVMVGFPLADGGMVYITTDRIKQLLVEDDAKNDTVTELLDKWDPNDNSRKD